MGFLLVLTAVLLAIFLISYLRDKTKLINGLLFNIFLASLMGTILFILFSTGNVFFMILGVVLLLPILIMLSLGIYALIVALFINAKIVMKRESRTTANLLTLFLAIALIVHVILSIINPQRFFSPEVGAFFSIFGIIELYFLFDVFNFLMISLIYQFNRPKLDQDFIIVLGSRLIGDKVPPLLASRINKAIEFYNKQAEVTKPPKIIFSGGQGSDEKIPEALGMQRYAIEKGVNPSDTILEDKSVSTLQNMTFSKNIMDELMPNKHNSIFVTNNYHLFRAGIYARIANLKSEGIGSKTALYFIPNAIIREYIAICVMNKKRHIIVVCLLLILGVILAILQRFVYIP
ncbi:YdcF family protein [Romboutsia maritimum]|uniref:YdcF family protein n=1 Tax=Romboutsia maritimum TaxID=2020948 RepID=A0A371ITJ2_9FIRM|nr:YdcF family protein [Romboutsia maritimum]RDY23806.1 YdcF family protein [Romboutsia maritimum]